MKIVLILIVMVLFFSVAPRVNAQIVSININSQPQWGPVEYDYVEYYYLPQHDIYYFAPGKQFVYKNGNKWIYAKSLPNQYRNVDLYRTYKVVINEPKPYLRNDYYASHYKEYKHAISKQLVIRDSKDPKYKMRNNRSAHSENNKTIKVKQKNAQPISHENNNKGSQYKSKGNKKR